MEQQVRNKILNFLEKSGNSQMTTAFVKNFFFGLWNCKRPVYHLIACRFFYLQALLYKNGLNCYRQMPKIWVKKSGKFNEEFKNGCKAKFLVSFYSAISFRFMDSRITTHTQF
jgi:hypothetical protein